MRAIVLHSLDKVPVVEEVEKPRAKAGQVVVEIIGTDLSPNTKQILTGALPFKPSAFPCIPGGSAVGRVHELGSDATTLQVGQLVFASLVTRARDNPEIEILQGVGTALTPSAHKLTSGDYRNGALAEFAAFPIENIVPLDEEALASVGLGSDRYADLLSLTP
jgi:NADPH:quinone reductase-like Zn-dependent oxidoreductase